MFDGVVPGTAVVANGCVAELGWFETIADRGTAVGFVANRETLGSVVGAKTVAEATEPDDPVAVNDTWLGEVAWRAPRTLLYLRSTWSTWAATKMGTTARTAERENLMKGGNKEGSVGTKRCPPYFHQI